MSTTPFMSTAPFKTEDPTPRDTNIYEQLRRPFDPKVVERTKSSDTRKGYDTTGIKYQAVVDRLNEVLGIDGWETEETIEIVGYETRNKAQMYQATCRLTLIVFLPGGRKAKRTCYGGHDSKTRYDAHKGAWTNALKKTAALFGVGGQAYLGQLDDDNEPPAPNPEQPQGSGGTGGADDPDTDAQLRNWKFRTEAAKNKLRGYKAELGKQYDEILANHPKETLEDLEAAVAKVHQAAVKNRGGIGADAKNRFWVLVGQLGWSDVDAADDLKEVYGVVDPGDLTPEQLAETIARHEANLKEKTK